MRISCLLLSYGSSGLSLSAQPSHRTAMIILVPPVCRKLLSTAYDHASYSLFILESLESVSWYLSHILAAVLFSQPGGPVFLCSSLCRYCTVGYNAIFLSFIDLLSLRSKSGVLMQPSDAPGRNLDLSSLVAFDDAL